MMMSRPKKQPVKTYENVFVHWLEYRGNWSPPEKLHRQDCKVIDKGNQSVVVVFPEGDRMQKKKTSSGFRINFVRASEFLRKGGVSNE